MNVLAEPVSPSRYPQAWLGGWALLFVHMATSKPRLQTLGVRVAFAPVRLPQVQSASWRSSKQSSTQRGYDYRWQKARAAFLKDHPFCAYCLRDVGICATAVADVILECAARNVPVPYGNVVDHRIPHRGDKALFWDQSNWQTLCQTHHSRDKQRQECAA